MKCVILAAGRGTRMGALTENCPKPMLLIGDKPKLVYTFDILPEAITEVVFVIGYLGEQIREYFGEEYKGYKISYVTQDLLDGTGGAIERVQELVGRERFLVLNGDDLYAREDLEQLVQHNFSVLGVQTDDVTQGAAIISDGAGVLQEIREMPHGMTGTGIVNTGACTLSGAFFDHPLVPKAEGSDEYGLPQTLMAITGIVVHVITTEKWFPVGDPEALEVAQKEIDKFL